MKVLEIHKKGSINKENESLILSPGNNPRQVSMVDGKALHEARKMPGLCTKRFDADLITEGIDYQSLLQGNHLFIGDIELEISSTGKKCYDDCLFHQAGNTCTLPQNCAFACVIKGGMIMPSVEIILKTIE